MLIKAYGLFWRRDEVDWTPGKGIRAFRLLGNIGTNRPGLRMIDARDQEGLYVLYSEYGPAYVGLTNNLGSRLKGHHKAWSGWDRFSWFGFRQVLRSQNPDGTSRLKDLPSAKGVDPKPVIREMEALLIAVLGTADKGAGANRNTTKFQGAERWYQTPAHDADRLLSRLKG